MFPSTPLVIAMRVVNSRGKIFTFGYKAVSKRNTLLTKENIESVIKHTMLELVGVILSVDWMPVLNDLVLMADLVNKGPDVGID